MFLFTKIISIFMINIIALFINKKLNNFFKFMIKINLKNSKYIKN